MIEKNNYFLLLLEGIRNNINNKVDVFNSLYRLNTIIFFNVKKSQFNYSNDKKIVILNFHHLKKNINRKLLFF
jgi:hypothetical protein